ncbi:MAG: putative heme d1 biosynthesis radical SAM protein NirJ2 [Bacillota bacterium]|nr:putative heme d1 biosynthesis radical SAM protein NirJ2 [Bacillota bacterium]
MIISWNTTRACNLNCKHCYRDAGQKEANELSTEEGMKLLDEIARAGFRIMVFSGGEPLLREDIYDLVAHAKRRGLVPVFGSNGTLIDARVAKRLKEAGAVRMGISIHSATPDFHDEFHRSPGSWQAAIDGVKYCLEAGLEVQLHTTVTEPNYDEVERITDLAVELGAAAHHVFFLVPTGRGKDLAEDMLNATRYERLLHRILEKQRQVKIELKPTCAPQFMRIARQKGIPMRFTRGCLAGTSYCVIIPNGDVNPCPYLYLKVGNVRETPFDEIWREAPVFRQLRTLHFGGRCGTCDYKEICGGCRARAYYYTGGDYMAEDPWCLYRAGVQAAGGLATGAAGGGAG